MDDRHRARTLGSEDMDMAHHIVTQLFFFALDGFKVDIFEVCGQTYNVRWFVQTSTRVSAVAAARGSLISHPYSDKPRPPAQLLANKPRLTAVHL